MKSSPTDYLPTIYRVFPTSDANAPHFSGGAPDLDGAICPCCSIPLLQFWNIDCSAAPCIGAEFGPWSRLPLLFCLRCFRDVYYMPLNSNAISVFPTDKVINSGQSFPYDDYPSFYVKRPIALASGIPDDVKAIVSRILKERQMDRKADDAEAWTPSEAEMERVIDFFGHPVRSTICLAHHQFGGHSLAPPWEDDIYKCPNRQCKAFKKRMKFLARVLNAPHHDLPMLERFDPANPATYNYFIGVQFHICGSCFTLVGSSRGS